MDRRKFLSTAKLGLGYGILGTGCADAASDPFAVELTSIQSPNDDAPPLAEYAAAARIKYGAAISSHCLRDEAFAAAVARECEVIVSEGDMKWGAVRPSPDQFDFSRADRFIAFAQSQRLAARGHTLVWHGDMPKWVGRTLNAHNAERHLLHHLNTVVGRYAGTVTSWDVVNEAVAPEDREQRGLRRSLWYELLGPRYIDLAFRAVAEADPDATLVYNEARLDYDTQEHERCRIAVLMLLERLVSQGVPVHAVGIQAHLDATERRFNGARLQRFLDQLAGMGLDIYITELDVSERGLTGSVRDRDEAIAAVYAHYLDVVLEVPAVKAVLTWGLSDRYTWLNTTQPRMDGRPLRPLPLDADLRRKMAWQAIADAYERRARRMAGAVTASSQHAENSVANGASLTALEYAPRWASQASVGARSRRRDRAIGR